VVSSSGFSDTIEKISKENKAGKQNNEVIELVQAHEQEKLMNPAAEHNKQDGQVCHTSLEPKNKRGAMATKPLAELVQESDGGKLNDRFSDPVRDIEEWLKPYIPRNTAKNTKWAYNNFLSWLKARNAADTPSLDILKTCCDPDELATCLSKFVLETRTVKGEHYAPRTINMLLAGLHRYVQTNNPNKEMLNFMRRDLHSFKGLHATCDRYFRQLRTMGIGANPRSTVIITAEEEDTLWKSEVLGLHTPKALLNAAFYYNGKNFHLRGGEEHRFLRLSQFQRHVHPDRYEYTESGSKNNSGGIEDIRGNVRNKIVPIYSNPASGDRCHVRILDLYISKLPPEAKQHDCFYLKPKSAYSPSDEVWYTNQVVGKNELARMVPTMFKEAKLSKHATNHSLRATGATELYRCGVPENIIKERTGHKSLDGVRAYERTTVEQQRAVSRILTDANRSVSGSFNDILSKEEEGKGLEKSPVRESAAQKRNLFRVPTTAPGNVFNFEGCKVTIVQQTTTAEEEEFDAFVSKHLESLPF
jgi:hypothetical protein